MSKNRTLLSLMVSVDIEVTKKAGEDYYLYCMALREAMKKLEEAQHERVEA